MSCIQPASAPELAIQPTSVCGSVQCMVLFASAIASLSVWLLSLFASIEFRRSQTEFYVGNCEYSGETERYREFR